MAGLPAFSLDIEYPESDGQPVAETQPHFDEMVDLVKALEDHFRHEPRVWVGGNLFVYYEQGNPSAVVAPDVVVAKEVDKVKRNKYLLWEEGEAPCFVIEVTSKHTKTEDTSTKKRKYARLGVKELFLFDLLGDYLEPRFQGFRLVKGAYKPMRPMPDGSLLSRELGLILTPEGAHLRLTDTVTGKVLLRIEEVQEGQRAAEERAAQEAARRRDAEKRADEAESRALAAEALGTAKAVLMLLADRAVEVHEEARARILGCTDPDLLRRWLVRATSADSVEEVLT